MSNRKTGKPIVHCQGLDMSMMAVFGRLIDDIEDMRGSETVVVYACDLQAVMREAAGAGTMYARKKEDVRHD